MVHVLNEKTVPGLFLHVVHKINPTNAKVLTAMKQKIKKSIKEYETDVNKYNAHSSVNLLVVRDAPPAAGSPRPIPIPAINEKGEGGDFKIMGKGGKAVLFRRKPKSHTPEGKVCVRSASRYPIRQPAQFLQPIMNQRRASRI
ncbi:hypothetical protein B0H11DRAFT_1912523 [Mycena galericulata]|nr:hypothetical protein B0H11DRAFT_1912523 [Mycena galericulata]